MSTYGTIGSLDSIEEITFQDSDYRVHHSFQNQGDQLYGINHIIYSTSESDFGSSIIKCNTSGYAIYGTKITHQDWHHSLLIRTDEFGMQRWTQSYQGGIGEENGVDLLELDNGGFILLGSSFNYQTIPSESYIHLIQTDSNGHLQWDHYYGKIDIQYPTAIIQCENDNIVIGATFHNTVDYYEPDAQAWVLRVNSTSELLWEKAYYFTKKDEHDTCWTIIECQSGGFALAGTSRNENYEAYQGWLLRIDDDGNQLWNHTYPGSIEFRSLVECNDDGLAILGMTNPHVSDRYTGDDVFILRTNATGHELWRKTYGSFGNEWGRELIKTDDGGFAFTGYSNSTPNGDYDLLFLQTDHEGEVIREFTYGGNRNDEGFSLVYLGDNEFAITGSTSSFGNGKGDVWLVRVLNPESNPPIWVEIPSLQFVPYGLPFSYTLNAVDSSGLNTWWVSDSLRFVINDSGVISSRCLLPVGVIFLQVWVNDIFNNILTGKFAIVVTPSEIFLWHITIAFIVILPIVFTIILGVYLHLQRRYPLRKK